MPSDPSALQFRHRFGAADFDESRMELRIGGHAVALQRRPLELLRLLLRPPGRVVTKDEALRALWRGRALDIYSDATLANAVSKLRRALGPGLSDRVVTVARQGFRFDGDVDRIATGLAALDAGALAAGQPVVGRESCVLLRRIDGASGQPVFLARQRPSGALRVFKFALDGRALSRLQREFTLQRYLRRRLGPRPDMALPTARHFDAPPFWTESAHAGTSLDAWVAGPDGAALPRDERLALFLQVADAVAAVHSVQVLHGDLKPANVLVDAAPHGWQVRLIDFGSARLLDPDALAALGITALGLTLVSDDSAAWGTPLYWAPELLRGAPPGVATEVYALGLLLYQLLAGDFRRPLAPGWQRDVHDTLLADDIAQATDGDPARRFATVADLAARLRALPERRAEAALQQQQEAQRAELRAAAERAFDRFVREDLIAAANPAAGGRADVTVADAIDSAAARIDTRFAGQPAEVRAGLHGAMQSALSELARTPSAVAAGRQAVAAWLSAALPDPQALADTRLRLAVDLVQLSELDAARAVAAEIERDAPPALRAQPVFRARLLYVQSWLTGGALALETSLAQLDAAWALVQPLTEAVAPGRDKIGFALADNLALLGRNAESEALCRQLLDAQLQAHGARHVRPLVTRVVLGRALSNQHRHAEARAELDAAVAGLSDMLGPRHRMTLDARGLLAEILFKDGAHAAAAAEWSALHAAMSELLGAGSSYAITLQTNLALALHRGGAPDQAEPLLRDALQRVRAFVDDAAPQPQQIRYALAECLLDLDRADAAAPLLDGLDAAALNLAQQEPDWPARLALQRGRAVSAARCRSTSPASAPSPSPATGRGC